MGVSSNIKPDFLRQRRNLITFSIGLILLNLLDAKFGSNGSLLLGSFTLPRENAYILLYATWIGFFYFLWRYWIFGGNTAMDDLKAVFNEMLNKNKKYINHIKEKYSPIAITQVKNNNDTSNHDASISDFVHSTSNRGKDFVVKMTFTVNISGSRYNTV